MTKRTAEQNAEEFGVLTKQGKDVRLALLVACSVEKGAGQGSTTPRSDRNKVSAQTFAATAGSTATRVLRHLTAWGKFAKLTGLPVANQLVPTDAVTLEITEEQAEIFANEVDLDSKGGGDGSQKAKDIGSNTNALKEAITSNPKVAEAIAQDADSLKAIIQANERVRKTRAAATGGKQMPKPKPLPSDDRPERGLNALEVNILYTEFLLLGDQASDVRKAHDVLKKLLPYADAAQRHELEDIISKVVNAWDLLRTVVTSPTEVSDDDINAMIDQQKGA